MKRRKLIDHLISNGCVPLREGGRHTIFYNPQLKKTSYVPLAKKICKDLGIPEPKN